MISKRPRCFLDIEVGNEYVGRIIVELFADVCPITCENFRLLCSGEKGIGKTTKKPLHFRGTLFHRIVKNFVIQGGDFVFGDGRGGESVYGGQFKDENFHIPHDQPFILSMANKGKDSNGSQFFITTQAAPHLDGKHTVFGKVISGQEVVTLIENVETDSSCRPLKDVKISNCGEMILQVKSKEKKKKREYVSASSSESDDKSRKKRKKHVKKHKRDKKEYKRSSAEKDDEDDKCLLDPEEIPSVPTNRFLLRNTSPMAEGRRSFSRPRDSYSFSRRPHRSKSGRKIKGRGFMRYRTPSPTGSRSGSETPPHWKQAQSRLRKMPSPPKESTPDNSRAEEEFEHGQDEELAIQNSLLPSRLGKTTEGAFENLRKNSSNENHKSYDEEYRYKKEQKYRSFYQSDERNMDRKFQERTFSYREQTRTSPLRSKIVVKSSREHEDWYSDRKMGKDTERRGRKEFITERKPFSNEFERSFNIQKHVTNERQVNKNEESKIPEKRTEPSLDDKKRIKSLKMNLFRYANYDEESSSNSSQMKEKPKIKKGNESQKDNTSQPANKSPRNTKSLKMNLLRYANFDEGRDSKDSLSKEKPKVKKRQEFQNDANVPGTETIRIDKSMENENKAECLTNIPEDEKLDKDFKLSKSGSNSPKSQTPKNSLEFNLLNETENDVKTPNDKIKAHAKHLDETLEDKHLMITSDRETVTHEVHLVKIPDDKDAIHYARQESDAMENTASIELNAVISANESTSLENRPMLDIQDRNITSCMSDLISTESINKLPADPQTYCSPSDALSNIKFTDKNSSPKSTSSQRSPDVETIPSINPKSPVQAVDTLGTEPNNGEADISVVDMQKEVQEEHIETEESHEAPNKEQTLSSEHKKPSTPPTPESPHTELKKASPIKKYDRSSRSSSSSSPTRRRKISKSPSDKVASSSKKNRTSVDHRSKSPVHKPRTSSSHRTSRSQVSRRSKSRSRSRSGKRSTSPPRNRNRRRISRSPDIRLRRSRSRPRNDRGSRFHQYQGLRHYSPPRRGSFNRPYARGRIKNSSRHSRSRSRSLSRRRRRQRRSSSSSASTSRHSSSSDSNAGKNKSRKIRKKKRSSSSSSSSSRNSRSESDSP